MVTAPVGETCWSGDAMPLVWPTAEPQGASARTAKLAIRTANFVDRSIVFRLWPVRAFASALAHMPMESTRNSAKIQRSTGYQRAVSFLSARCQLRAGLAVNPRAGCPLFPQLEQRDLHHRPGVTDIIDPAGIAAVLLVLVILHAAGMFGHDQAAIVVLYQLLHHRQHVVVSLVIPDFDIFLVGL